jgi:hypothetical protein
MKMIRSSRRGRYVARVGIFLIMAASIARMVGRGERVVLRDEFVGGSGTAGDPWQIAIHTTFVSISLCASSP